MAQVVKEENKMHKNLIKINDLLAFVEDDNHIISLMCKKNNAFSFEEILKNERVIETLKDEINAKEDEKQQLENNSNNVPKSYWWALFFNVLITIYFVSQIIPIISYISVPLKVLIVILTTMSVSISGINLHKLITNYRLAKENNDRSKFIDEELAKLKQSLNTKKEILEYMLHQVDLKEYFKQSEIENILNNNAYNSEYSYALTNDASNKVTLDGPTRNRRKDV